MTSLLVGRWGEAQAAEFLRKKKYKIIAVNFRSRFGEIDIIAENKKQVLFVEVKLRKNKNYGLACEFVTPEKQRKLKTTAESWHSMNPTDKELRFDVIEVYAPNGISDEFTINHIENAF